MKLLIPTIEKLICSFLAYLSMNEQSKLKIELDLLTFSVKAINANLNVTVNSRFSLENISIHSSYMSFLTNSYELQDDECQNKLALVKNMFSKLVTKTIYANEKFDFSQVRGCSDSKSFFNILTFERVESYSSMQEWGLEITDLEKLHNRTNVEKIEICKDHEGHLYKQVKLINDNWNSGFYMDNTGGSHHAAVLSYLLQKENRSFFINAEITSYDIQMSVLAKLDSVVASYVYQDEYSVINLVPRDMLNKIPFFEFDLPLNSNNTGYIVLVLFRNYANAETVITKFNSLVAEGNAITFPGLLRNLHKSNK